LQDNLTLKDCIRHNTDVKNHIIHLVHSTHNITSNNNNLNKSKLSPNTSRNEIEYDIENELTPNTSTSSSDSYSTTSESSSSDLEAASPSTSSNANNNNETNPLSESAANMNIFNRIQNNVARHHSNVNNQTKLTEKQQYDQILNSLTNYYQSFGIQVQNNPWYSSYIQQLALYNHM
jgi:hypothetical protein